MDELDARIRTFIILKLERQLARDGKCSYNKSLDISSNIPRTDNLNNGVRARLCVVPSQSNDGY